MFKDINSGLKNFKESREDEEDLSLFCQYSYTFVLQSFLVLGLSSGLLRRVRGCGRLYCWHSFAIEMNHDLSLSLPVVSLYLAILLRM